MVFSTNGTQTTGHHGQEDKFRHMLHTRDKNQFNMDHESKSKARHYKTSRK